MQVNTHLIVFITHRLRYTNTQWTVARVIITWVYIFLFCLLWGDHPNMTGYLNPTLEGGSLFKLASLPPTSFLHAPLKKEGMIYSSSKIRLACKR